MQKKILINNLKTYFPRFSKFNIKPVSSVAKASLNKPKFNLLTTFPKRFFVQGDLNRIFKENKYTEENNEPDPNPITNFLFSELKKINDKEFNIDEFCLGLRSLENIRLSAQDLHQNLKEITHMFESIINSVVSSGKLNKQSVEVFLPQTSKISYMYSIDTSSIRFQFMKICVQFCNDLSISIVI
jgi:hypothetical protein